MSPGLVTESKAADNDGPMNEWVVWNRVQQYGCGEHGGARFVYCPACRRQTACSAAVRVACILLLDGICQGSRSTARRALSKNRLSRPCSSSPRVNVDASSLVSSMCDRQTKT